MKYTTKKSKLNRPIKNKVFQMRLSEQESLDLRRIEEDLGINRSDLIRKRVLTNTASALLNAKVLLKQLDSIGMDLGKAGNYIYLFVSQLNGLNREEQLISDETVAEFNQRFNAYIRVQQQLETAMRNLIRSIRI
jgi:hypothetical protein